MERLPAVDRQSGSRGAAACSCGGVPGNPRLLCALAGVLLIAASGAAEKDTAAGPEPPAKPRRVLYDLSIEGGGGYRLSPDAASLSSPFLSANIRPEVEGSFGAAWKAVASGELSASPYASSDLDWSGMAGAEVQRTIATRFFIAAAVNGGYYRSSEPLLHDPLEYFVTRGRAECGVKNRNSLSVQYLFDAINDLPYWTAKHHLRLQAGIKPRTWLSSTIQAGFALARSEQIATAALWDSVSAYAEISAAASGLLAVRSKNLFSLLCRGQWRRYEYALAEPAHGASPRESIVTQEDNFACAASLLYCRSFTQHIDFYADCMYYLTLREWSGDVWNTIRLSISIAWHLQSL